MIEQNVGIYPQELFLHEMRYSEAPITSSSFVIILHTYVPILSKLSVLLLLALCPGICVAGVGAALVHWETRPVPEASSAHVTVVCVRRACTLGH